MVALQSVSAVQQSESATCIHISPLFWISFPLRSGFPGGSEVPAVWETWVPSLGQEDPLEKGMTTQSSILAWGVLWTEEPGEQESHHCEFLKMCRSVIHCTKHLFVPS